MSKQNTSITGKTLVELGYRPGPWFKTALAHLAEHPLAGADLRNYLDSVAPKIIDPHATPRPFHENIRPENEVEALNVTRVRASMELLMTTPTALEGSVMPDACPAGPHGTIRVGGVVATHNAIHPAMHSADICCSVMMTSFGHVDPKTVLDAAHSVTHFGGGGRSDTFDLAPELARRIDQNRYLNNERSQQLARTHLGTQGDGNHFLFVGRSEQSGETILVTHHGSRGFGAQLYRQGTKLAEHFRQQISPRTPKYNAWIPADSEEGEGYWEALQVVRDWTLSNHTVLHDAALKAVGRGGNERFWNEHNFVFRDGDVFYHAKGATPLADKFVPDSHEGLRLIPLNMREPVLVVKGAPTATNLGFAPHGAGRNVSRTQHIRNQGDRTAAGVFAEETEGLDVRFFSGNIDVSELPTAYKNAAAVQAQMEEFGLGEVQDRILPYGCIMAGDIPPFWLNKKKRGRR